MAINIQQLFSDHSSTHPFEHFDRSLLKTKAEDFDNPISQLLAKHLIFSVHLEGKFLPIPFPTGIGKTHNLICVIYEAILHRIIQPPVNTSFDVKRDKNALPLFIFMTNSVNNVKEAYDKLCQLIQNDPRLNTEQKQWLKAQLVYAPATTTSLQQCIEDGFIESILDIFEINHPVISKNIGELRTRLETLRQSQNQKENNPFADSFKKELDRLSQDTFNLIFNHIAKKQKSVDSIELSSSQIDTVSKLITGIRIEYNQAQAVFLTTKKFLYGIHQTTGKYHFTNDMAQHTLLIDEIDRQNNEILAHLVEAIHIDILARAKTLLANLQFNQLCHKPQFRGIDELVQKYLQGLEEFVQSYHLHLSFDMDQELSRCTPNPLLFSDKLATHTTNINNRLFFQYEKQDNQHIIFADPRRNNQSITDNEYFDDTSNSKDYPDSWVKFTEFLNELNQWIGKRFTFMVMAAIELYKENVSKTTADSSNTQLSESSSAEALGSILHQLNLYDLIDSINKQLQALSGRKHLNKSSDRTYHTRGISLIEIGRPINTNDSVFFNDRGFDVSPTGMLASYVEQGATVIGISATANCESVIHNFDIDYLKSRLSGSFVQLAHDERQAIDDYYQSMRDYERQNIQLHVTAISSDISSLLNAFCDVYYSAQHKTKPNIKDPSIEDSLKQQVLSKLDLLEENTAAENCFYKLEWLNKLCQAIEYFYQSIDQSNRYMMAMLNRFVNKATASFLREYIKFLDDKYLGPIPNIKTQLFTRVDSAFLKQGNFDSHVKHALSNTHDRVIVLTTYQTLSSGANPDYAFADWETNNLRLVAPRSYAQSTDIDTMYLERGTHIISASDNPEMALNSRLTLLAQGMALYEAGQLSEQAKRKWVRTIIHSANMPQACMTIKWHHYNHKTKSDYIAACCRDIEQAIGRSNRTAFKRPHIYLMYDAELQPILASDDRPDAITSHEYKALIAHAKDNYSADNSSNNYYSSQSKEFKRLHNQAQKLSQRSNQYINTLLGKIQILSTIESPEERKKIINNWQSLRAIAGREPSSIMQPVHEWCRNYVQTPDKFGAGGYFYQYNSESDFNTYQFFDQGYRSEVSARDCRLDIMMKNSIIKSYFEECGLATQWHVNAEYVLTPPMYTNIYKGLLGEAGGSAILQKYGFTLTELPDEVFEVFDNIVHYNDHFAWIDFKHWDQDKWGHVPDEVKLEAMKKLANKVDQLSNPLNGSSNKLIVCNLMDNLSGDDEQNNIQYYDANFYVASPAVARIMTITGLIDSQSGDTNLEAVTAIKQWLLS